MPAPTRSPNPVALVTGAGHRVGRQIAIQLAAAGYKLIIHFHAAAQAANELRALIGPDVAAIIQCDLTDRQERSKLMERAAEPFGPISLLVNNASLFQPDSPETLDETLWDKHFAVHAEAPLFLARDFANQLPNDVQGSIINIIDERVINLSPAYTSYTLSKSVLWTATQTLAQALAPRIRVNAVGPGPTLPEKGETAAAFEQRGKKVPLGEPADPKQIADAVVYLANARSVTGQMIAVDGGQHLEFPDRVKTTPARS